MTRGIYCELILRQIYGGQPTDDSSITVNLVNTWLIGAIATAVKANYMEAIKMDGIAYSNNGFYTTFTGLPVTADSSENFLYSITLPHVPYALGKTDGVSVLKFKKDGDTSYAAIPLSQNQWAYRETIRKIPNKITYCPEGDTLKIESVLPLTSYTGTVTMVSTGVSSDLDSELHLPDDYFPLIVDYCKQQLMFERSVPKDVANDGQDGPIKQT